MLPTGVSIHNACALSLAETPLMRPFGSSRLRDSLRFVLGAKEALRAQSPPSLELFDKVNRKTGGAPIEAVGKAPRQSSAATTERFYARICSEREWDDLEHVWDTPVRVDSP